LDSGLAIGVVLNALETDEIGGIVIDGPTLPIDREEYTFRGPGREEVLKNK
jgi:hypothetical protein